MVHAILLCCAMLGDGAKPAETPETNRAAYQAAQAKAAKTPAAQIQLALWCEAHGLTAERIKHLTEAVSLDSSNVLARGLLGLVAFQGNWAKPDQVEQGIQSDPKFQTVFREYLDRRVRTPQRNVDAQLRLAAWCLENGLREEAMAHYHLVTRLDPSKDIAWIRQGYKKHRDRWFKPDDLAAKKLEFDRQKRADTEWAPRLEKLRKALDSAIEARRLKAEREVYRIADPRAVPSILKTLAAGSEKTQLVAVELLKQIEGPTASFGLALLAIEKSSPTVQERAKRALAQRDPRDVIGWLVNLIHKPYKYELVQAGGPGTAALLKVDGERFDLNRFYQPPNVDMRLVPVFDYTFGSQYTSANSGRSGSSGPLSHVMAGANRGAIFALEPDQQSQQMAALTQGQIENDVRMLDQTNAQIEQTNDRALPILESLTNQRFGVDPEQWQKWWADQLGFVVDSRSSEDKPTFTQVLFPIHSACFAAGTLVQTVTGLRKIEAIAVGDRVLSQQTSTGGLSFQPVLATHINGPADTARITVDGETIVATGIHRFWKAAAGWTMARDLKPGDRLRLIGGIVTVESIEPGAPQKVYNLTVAENNTFMVGKAGLLVHDFGFVRPVSEPFDRQTNPEPATTK
jgi:Pretoxin HINT domain